MAAICNADEITSPLCGDSMEDKTTNLPKPLEYMSCIAHLGIFGILGVLARYLLQKLFGPGVANVTGDHSILYLDLPSNMIGSFLMGWLGVVFKEDISSGVSDFLAIGLSTGFLGSLTTFSGWNQKMLDLSVNGDWLFCLLGFLIGFFLVCYSIIFGIETAKGFKWVLKRMNNKGSSKTGTNHSNSINKWWIQLVVLIVLMIILALLWSISGILLVKEFNRNNARAQLCLACVVGPFGVWVRWLLARLNGCGLGRRERMKWVPFGTMIANVSAACVMAALAIIIKEVNTSTCNTIVTGIQFGFLGCLSTVSTFVAEFNAMSESNHPWRAYAYALMTIGLSFGLGTLIYSVPVWTRPYS
ncbi:fluoride export protein 1-like [Tripterygium wilfordii]|uniref:fluoride export protein 1-like n=1 Tax=Tripterygium wilfordii TaxID=458696 RepID=UPI0018F85FD2|nr:fluoride export protein 1-like [Tripterygium wilfordii]